eukprot:1410134-Pyramimonas_sp.AAC.1
MQGNSCFKAELSLETFQNLTASPRRVPCCSTNGIHNFPNKEALAFHTGASHSGRECLYDL